MAFPMLQSTSTPEVKEFLLNLDVFIPNCYQSEVLIPFRTLLKSTPISRMTGTMLDFVGLRRALIGSIKTEVTVCSRCHLNILLWKQQKRPDTTFVDAEAKMVVETEAGLEEGNYYTIGMFHCAECEKVYTKLFAKTKHEMGCEGPRKFGSSIYREGAFACEYINSDRIKVYNTKYGSSFLKEIVINTEAPSDIPF